MFTVDYPAYVAAFVDDNVLVVGGGGGLGSHGLRNCLTTFSIDSSSLEVRDELVLSKGDDCPTSISVEEDRIYVGVNKTQGSDSVESQVRVYDKSLAQRAVTKVFKSGATDVYIKTLAATPKQIAVASSAEHAGLCMLSKSNLAEQWQTSLEEPLFEVSFNTDGRFLVACAEHHLYIYNTKTGSRNHTCKAPASHKKGGSIRFTRAVYLSKRTILASGTETFHGSSRAVLLLYEVTDGGLVEISKHYLRDAKGVSCLAAADNLVAVGTQNGDVHILSDELKPMRYKRRAHKFPVTSIAANQSGVVASVSLDGSISVIDCKVCKSGTSLGWVFVLSLIVTTVAILLSQNYIKQLIIETKLAPAKSINFNKLAGQPVLTATSSSAARRTEISPRETTVTITVDTTADPVSSML